MDTRTLQLLDYYRIRDEIAGCAMSEEARDKLLCREPFVEKDIIIEKKLLVAEWMRLLQDQKAVTLKSWQACKAVFAPLTVDGACLDLADLYALGTFCLATKLAQIDILGAQERQKTQKLANLANKLPNLSGAEAKIFSIVDAHGELRELAELSAIKNSILAIRRDIANLLKKYTTDTSLKDALQSDMPTIRSERQVLAVKANFRGRIKGIVHQVSQTGQTLYIEPDDVVQRNNDLIQEENRLSLELRRILQDATRELGKYYDDFVSAHAIMIELDENFASARWGVMHQCTLAEDIDEIAVSSTAMTDGAQKMTNGTDADGCDAQNVTLFSLLQCRHPLLGEKAVPISVQCKLPCKVIIITGPNTGGKTVTLKTIALFACLNQSAFPIPAKDGSCLPIFDAIFADIGDEQSIDNSLSTFSSHMKILSGMMSAVTEKSLILLDELGSGTDPQEGGAIAMSILDFLLEKNATVLVTTHHGVLKNYGYTKPTCTNASVDFDSTTLYPTYKIVMGLPGESHALDIASNCALPSSIIQKARSYIAGDQADVSSLIKGLTQKHAELDKQQSALAKNEQMLNQKSRELDLQALRLHQKEVDLQKQGFSRLNAYADESRKKLENLVRVLREGEITKEKTRAVKDFIAELSVDIQNEKILLEKELEKIAEEAKSIALLEEAIKKDKKNTKSAKTRAKEDAQNKHARHMQNELAKYAHAKNFCIKSSPTPLDILPKDFEAGLSVMVHGKEGTLVRKDKNGNWIVQIGSVKMTVKQSAIVPVEAKKASPSFTVEMADNSANLRTSNKTDAFDGATSTKQDKLGAFDAFNTGKKSQIDSAGIPGAKFHAQSSAPLFNNAQLELRILGMRYEEAMKTVERQIDLAVLQNLYNFSIIHGKGNGVLQQGVQEYLKNCPVVESFAFARPEHGGFGKTLVTLKKS